MQHQRRTDPGAHRSLTFLLRLLASKTPHYRPENQFRNAE